MDKPVKDDQAKKAKEDPNAFMTERITYDAGEEFAPSRYGLISKNDAIISPYRTYDLFFEITFHVLQKLGVYEDIGTPEECKKAMEKYRKAPEEQPATIPKELEGLSQDDLYLISRFGMTTKAIREVMKNVVHLVDSEVGQFAEAVDPDHEDLNDLVDGDFWDKETGEMRWRGYGAKVAFGIFQDVISFHTHYAGSTSALEACRMSGIDGFEPLVRRKDDD